MNFTKILAAVVMSVAFYASAASAQQIKLDVTVVNSICSDKSTAKHCYFSMKPLPFDGSVLIANRTVEQIRAANPNIDKYIKRGMLPRLHAIATRKVAS